MIFFGFHLEFVGIPGFLVCSPGVRALECISGACNIDRVYPRAWTIAIPAFLMLVNDLAGMC